MNNDAPFTELHISCSLNGPTVKQSLLKVSRYIFRMHIMYACMLQNVRQSVLKGLNQPLGFCQKHRTHSAPISGILTSNESKMD